LKPRYNGNTMKKLLKNKLLLSGVVGLLLGAAIILGVRFVTYKMPAIVHYHANFAVYVNGVREPFKGLGYYEETAAKACMLTPVDTPKERAHMHDNVSDVVHVEDHLVTWGNFMQNLGWGLGDDYLKTKDTMLVNNDTSTLSFILNGQQVESISDQIIQDKDRLLISYGSANSLTLQAQYKTIARTAGTYDSAKDPASCSAGHSEVTTLERLQHLF
jgi:hypothetical protein